jgi:hypothetical protein
MNAMPFRAKEVIFDIGQSEFEEVQRVVDIISGKSSPDDGHPL